MSNMTPFEIRLDLLKLSKDLMMEEFQSKKDLASSEWNAKADWARMNSQPVPDHPALPPYPTETDIIAKATTLNGFVSQSHQEVKTSKKST